MREFYQASVGEDFFGFWQKAIDRSLSIQKICLDELSHLWRALSDIGLSQTAIKWMLNHPITTEEEIKVNIGEKYYQLFIHNNLLTCIDRHRKIFQINPIAMTIAKMDDLLFS